MIFNSSPAGIAIALAVAVAVGLLYVVFIRRELR